MLLKIKPPLMRLIFFAMRIGTRTAPASDFTKPYNIAGLNEKRISYAFCIETVHYVLFCPVIVQKRENVKKGAMDRKICLNQEDEYVNSLQNRISRIKTY
jgi:hypothetical protein